VHLTSNPTVWYAARGAGVAAYVLLSIVIVVGLLLAGRSPVPAQPRAAIVYVHRFGGLAIAAFLVLHVVTLGIDAWLPFSLTALVVPFVSSVRSPWMGLGIIAAELLAALGIANALVRRRRIPYRVWRTLHYANWAVWLSATAHVVGTGTDRSTPWLAGTVAVCAAAVAGAAAWRVTRRRRWWPVLVPIAGLAASAAVAVVVAGPLHPAARPWNAVTFSDRLAGALDRQHGGDRGLISLHGDGTGGQRVFVRVDLLATPDGISSTSLQLEYLPSGDQCKGEVTQIAQDGRGFTGWCALKGAVPERRRIVGHWDPGDAAGLVGTIVSSPEAS
jgi:sulfoxide reductase heme-binding subunit YedZ